jgi:hypothetical protein
METPTPADKSAALEVLVRHAMRLVMALMSEHKLDELIKALAAASDVGEPIHDEILAIRWHTTDRIIDRAANDAWLRLQHFAFDSDIRNRDQDYDKKMRAELKWRAAELEQLIAGQDPYGRRQSTLERIKRWLHPN